MRIPLTKYGWPEVFIYPVVILAVIAEIALCRPALLRLWGFISIEVLLGAVLVWVLSFFRDPKRICPKDGNLLLAPADGKITDIETLQSTGGRPAADVPVFLKAQGGQDMPILRIGIFLSIFNTHINRSPCNVRVEKITYKRGRYKNALNPESSRVNESNELCMIRTDNPQDRLIVRQISGAIARRIVCDTMEGKELTCGQKFGMLKFGSRTELYVPMRDNSKCLVNIGDKVKAGLTPLVIYELPEND